MYVYIFFSDYLIGTSHVLVILFGCCVVLLISRDLFALSIEGEGNIKVISDSSPKYPN